MEGTSVDNGTPVDGVSSMETSMENPDSSDNLDVEESASSMPGMFEVKYLLCVLLRHCLSLCVCENVCEIEIC